MSKKILSVIVIGAAVIFFAAGYCVKGALKNKQDTFQAGWAAARAKLNESGFTGICEIPKIDMNKDIKRLSGEIQEISGNKITLKIQPLEILADESLNTRIITVDAATKMYSYELKGPQEQAAYMITYNKEMAARKDMAVRNKGAATIPEPVALPDPYKKVEISLSDLKAGQTINIKAGEDIKEVKEFTAVEIDYSQPLVPEAAPVPAT